MTNKKKTKKFFGLAPHEEICAGCQKPFPETDYGQLCRTIMNHKPVCSYECNKALGQVT